MTRIAAGRAFALGWARREPPLPAVAVTGSGLVAELLAVSTRRRVAAGAGLRVAAGGDSIVVIGDAEDLPWSDGACYLGRDCGLLVPSTRRPVPSAALWRDHVLGGDHGGPRMAVLLPGRVLIFEVPARPVDVSCLDARASR